MTGSGSGVWITVVCPSWINFGVKKLVKSFGAMWEVERSIGVLQ